MPDKKPVDLSFAMNLEPEKALEYFRSKGYIVPEKLSENWMVVQQEAHAKAFTVARCTNIDVLKDIRQGLDKALSEGKTFEQFQKELTPILQKKGWWGIVKDENDKDVQLGSPRRLKTIYDTNTRVAYNAGRYREMMENTEDRPYWQYDAQNDSRTRPSHRDLDGKVFRYDDPFWDTHYPPNGWGCRCGVRALDEDNMAEKKLKVEDSRKSKINERIIPDLGWRNNPGKEAWIIDTVVYEKAKDIDPKIKDKFIGEMVQNLPRKRAFASAVSQIIQDGYKVKGLDYTAGWINTNTLNNLTENKIPPITPVISMKDDSIAHAIRTTKLDAGKTSIDLAKQIPETIAAPDAVYLDEGSKYPALIYVKNLEDNKVLKIVVNINQAKKKRPINEVKTIGIVDKNDIQKDKRYKKLQ